MRYNRCVLSAAALVLALAAQSSQGHAQAGTAAEWTLVDRAIGRPGKPQPEEVQKYSFPRGDLHVTVGDVDVKPSLALGSWVAFKRMAGSDGEAMAMGDLVLTEGEAEEPRLLFLHFWANDDAGRLARGLRLALEQTRANPRRSR